MIKTWDYGVQAVLYADDGQAWKAALEAGLRPMAEYRRLNGGLFGRQFVGDRETVRAVAKKINTTA